MEIELIKCDGPCEKAYSGNLIAEYGDSNYCDDCAAEADAAHEDKDEDNIPL